MKMALSVSLPQCICVTICVSVCVHVTLSACAAGLAGLVKVCANVVWQVYPVSVILWVVGEFVTLWESVSHNEVVICAGGIRSGIPRL